MTIPPLDLTDFGDTAKDYLERLDQLSMKGHLRSFVVTYPKFGRMPGYAPVESITGDDEEPAQPPQSFLERLKKRLSA